MAEGCMNMDAVQEFRVRAEILHRHAQAGDVQALRRLKRSAGDGQSVRRTECFAALAAELGFTSWWEAKRVLAGAPGENYGTLLYPAAGSGHLNLWYRDRDEALRVRQSRNGWLLAYRHQFFVAERGFVEELGLAPDDPRWRAIAFDWTATRHSLERADFYALLLSKHPKEGDVSP